MCKSKNSDPLLHLDISNFLRAIILFDQLGIATEPMLYSTVFWFRSIFLQLPSAHCALSLSRSSCAPPRASSSTWYHARNHPNSQRLSTPCPAVCRAAR